MSPPHETGPGAPLPDREARRQAATRFDSNLVVLAGAGTGKTSLLVERALVAIGAGAVDVHRITALTFTEKAAGEMRDRLALGLERLHELAGGAEPRGATEAERAWRHLTVEAGLAAREILQRSLVGLEVLDRATFQTIHGFCAALLRADPVAAGVDPDFTIDAGQVADLLRRDEWEAYLAEELGASPARPGPWRALLARTSLEVVERAALALAASTIPDAALRRSRPRPTARDLFGSEASRLAEQVAALLECQRGMTANAVGYFRTVERCLRRFADEGVGALLDEVGRDERFREQVVGDARPRGFRRLRGASPEEAARLVSVTRGLVRGLLDVDEEATELLLEATTPFVLRAREALLRRGVVTFDGLLMLARDLLRDHAAIRRRLKQRYRMLLVDEFQDIDPLQYEIVLFLAEREEDAAPDAFSARLEPGKLFVVGDPKQSIYRFRGADYAAYSRAIEGVLGQGGTELVLSANFRSVQGIVDPINVLFRDARTGCWSASPYQPAYVPIRSVREREDRDPRTEVWTLAPGHGTSAEGRRQAEGEIIAEEIERLVTEGHAAFRHVGVLFRAYTSLAPYLRPLRRRGIPFVVDGGREFLERPEVSHLMAVLRALAQPSDPAALLAFLRSPAAGVADTDLAAHAAAGGRWDWRGDDPAGEPPSIAAAFRLLRDLAEEIRDLPADAAVRRVLRRSRLLPLGAAAFEGPQRVANLQKLASAAGELARDGRLSLERVVDALAEGRFTGIESDAPLADDTVDAVRITTIHRMKGLESSWIFLPDLAREGGRSQRDRTVARLTPSEAGSLLALRVDGIASPGAVWWERENERHETAEELRVLYVALTRARDRSVLLVGPSRGAPWVEALGPWGYDRAETPEDGARLCGGEVLHRIVRPDPAPRKTRDRSTTVCEPARRSHDSVMERLREYAARPWLVSPSDLGRAREPSAASPLPPSVPRAAELARVAGAVVHRLLEGWHGEPRRETLNRLAGLCEASARLEGVDRGELERETAELVRGFLDSGLAGRLLEVEILGREVPLIAAPGESTGVSRGRIDLLYRDADGRIVVADYKTDREADPERLRAAYADQLAAYAEAVREALPAEAPPRTEIWSLRTGTVIGL